MLIINNMNYNRMIARITSALTGAAIGAAADISAMYCVCFAMILMDAITSVRLERRAHKKYPHAADGKVKSNKIGIRS